MQKLRKSKQGFTIIEVLIVLAIAGLILLIVFLAVPALQRNSRNNGRRNDVSRMGSAVSDYQSNNNGDLPNGLAFVAAVQNAGNLAQYSPTQDLMWTDTATQDNIPADARPRVRLVVGGKCSDEGETIPGSSRQAALQYQLETSNSPTSYTHACLDV